MISTNRQSSERPLPPEPRFKLRHHPRMAPGELSSDQIHACEALAERLLAQDSAEFVVSRQPMKTFRGYEGPPSVSDNDFVHDASAHIGEAELATLEKVRELLVVDAQQVENGCLEIVDMDAAFRHVKAVVIRFTV